MPTCLSDDCLPPPPNRRKAYLSHQESPSRGPTRRWFISITIHNKASCLPQCVHVPVRIKGDTSVWACLGYAECWCGTMGHGSSASQAQAANTAVWTTAQEQQHIHQGPPVPGGTCARRSEKSSLTFLGYLNKNINYV